MTNEIVKLPARLTTASATEPRILPHNIEAEQALLGAILISDSALDRVSDVLESFHFFDPVHGRIYEAMLRFGAENKRITPITLRPFFENEEAIGALTVPQYLGRLAANATSVINARDYAKTIHDLWTRREGIAIGDDFVNGAYAISADVPFAEQIEAAESRLFRLSGVGASASLECTAAEAAESALEMISAAYQGGSGLAGLATGLIDIDGIIGGLAPGNLYILAGRPSMGKSALAATIAFNVAKQLRREFADSSGGRAADSPIQAAEGPRKMGEVSFYSLEMSSEQLTMRQLAAETGIPADRQRRGRLYGAGEEGNEGSEHEFSRLTQAARVLGDLPLHIDATGALPIEKLAARARRRHKLYGTQLIVVDYLQLVRGRSKGDNRAAEVAEITTGLKALAKELKIPILALSQLSREVERREDKRPQLSDLRESGAIEQDADVVTFVFREQYYLERSEPPTSKVEEHVSWEARLAEVTNLAEFIVGKNRHGSVGTRKLHFDGPRTLFSDLESRH